MTPGPGEYNINESQTRKSGHSGKFPFVFKPRDPSLQHLAKGVTLARTVAKTSAVIRHKSELAERVPGKSTSEAEADALRAKVAKLEAEAEAAKRLLATKEIQATGSNGRSPLGHQGAALEQAAACADVYARP